MGLLEAPTISSVDFTDNKIEDETALEEVFEKMPNLAVLYLVNNDIGKKTRHYRKTYIHKIKKLKYLDDRPIFEDEYRYVDAFFRGGLEEEREERKRYK